MVKVRTGESTCLSTIATADRSHETLVLEEVFAGIAMDAENLSLLVAMYQENGVQDLGQDPVTAGGGKRPVDVQIRSPEFAVAAGHLELGSRQRLLQPVKATRCPDRRSQLSDGWFDVQACLEQFKELRLIRHRGDGICKDTPGNVRADVDPRTMPKLDDTEPLQSAEGLPHRGDRDVESGSQRLQ